MQHNRTCSAAERQFCVEHMLMCLGKLGRVFLQELPFAMEDWPANPLWKTGWIAKWWAEGSLERWCQLQLQCKKEWDGALEALNNPHMSLALGGLAGPLRINGIGAQQMLLQMQPFME